MATKLNLFLDERPCDRSNEETGENSICREDGLWRPQQCDGNGVCWCVNALNGQPDHSSKTSDIHQQNCGLFIEPFTNILTTTIVACFAVDKVQHRKPQFNALRQLFFRIVFSFSSELTRKRVSVHLCSPQ